MMENLIEYIEGLDKDDKLIKFIEKVKFYREILSDEDIRFFFVASLADINSFLTEEDCLKGQKILSFLEKNIDLICDDEELKKQLSEQIVIANKIATENLKLLEEESNKNFLKENIDYYDN